MILVYSSHLYLSGAKKLKLKLISDNSVVKINLVIVSVSFFSNKILFSPSFSFSCLKNFSFSYSFSFSCRVILVSVLVFSQ